MEKGNASSFAFMLFSNRKANLGAARINYTKFACCNRNWTQSAISVWNAQNEVLFFSKCVFAERNEEEKSAQKNLSDFVELRARSGCKKVQVATVICIITSFLISFIILFFASFKSRNLKQLVFATQLVIWCQNCPS